MRTFITTAIGKWALGVLSVAAGFLAAGLTWWSLTDSERQADLAVGVMRAGELFAAVGFLLAVQHRGGLRRRGNNGGR
ncbi:hypothetical protein [Streptomyces sp. NPDC002088]|uniref:hypothetical protein n=1 Tax=Streptomyces sp. NPDC002088 TaxID=3154665 RepID=UPI0033328D75